MKTSSIAVETSRSISQSDSIVRQTNKRSFLSWSLFMKYHSYYINVDEVSWITFKNYYKVRWNYYKLRQLSLLQSAMDSYYKVRWIYYKLRQILQSAMIITNCDSTNVPDTLTSDLPSRYSAGSYAFAVEGFWHYFRRSRSGQVHSFMAALSTDLSTLCRDKSHTYLPLP